MKRLDPVMLALSCQKISRPSQQQAVFVAGSQKPRRRVSWFQAARMGYFFLSQGIGLRPRPWAMVSRPVGPVGRPADRHPTVPRPETRQEARGRRDAAPGDGGRSPDVSSIPSRERLTPSVHRLYVPVQRLIVPREDLAPSLRCSVVRRERLSPPENRDVVRREHDAPSKRCDVVRRARHAPSIR